jgi:acetoin utilization deacetylase AcuC-like enzyme
MTTAFITNPNQADHDDPSHVERAARIAAILAALDESGLRSELHELVAEPATDQQILAVHSAHLLSVIRSTTAHEFAHIDGDTYTTSGSYEAARLAAGSAVRAVDAVVRGEVSNAFVLGRPPGHHATPTHSMGFCLFNNIAIAARYATDVLKLERVAIVDYDVHHGNGTQDCFYEDGQVLFCSSHAWPLYPGSGASHEMGEESGYGLTLNMPVPHGTGDQGITSCYDRLVLPALEAFQPQLILVSAGYDGHWRDPLGPLTISTTGYAALTKRLVDAAQSLCDGRIVMVLEGGYDLDAIASCVVASFNVLLGREPGPDLLGSYRYNEPDLSVLIERTLRNHPIFR